MTREEYYALGFFPCMARRWLWPEAAFVWGTMVGSLLTNVQGEPSDFLVWGDFESPDAALAALITLRLASS